jgi:nucleoside phosphorylase
MAGMSLISTFRRRTLAAAGVLAVGAGVAIASGAGAATAPTCVPRVLVVSAMPSELGPLLDATQVQRTVDVGVRRFYVGRLQSNNVILAMSDIGLTNAHETAAAAFQQFRCSSGPGISAVIFSGVSGGTTNIGDVTVVDQWALNPKGPWYAVDPTMMSVAQGAARGVQLEQRTPTGDPACSCIPPDRVKSVTVAFPPRVVFHGRGLSADPFGSRRFFCVPSGGAVFGCEPCNHQAHSPSDAKRFQQDVRPFIGPGFFLDYFRNPSASGTSYEAADMETAAVAQVAAANHTPFLAFRALSDGKGDRLHLPGFPFQFFIYYQLAADTAATMAQAFLKAWAHH